MEASTLNPPADADEATRPEDMTIPQLVELAEGGGEITEEQARDAHDELEARADDGVQEAKDALEQLGADAEVIEPVPAAEQPAASLPEAADDDGSDVDLSNGVELQLPGLEGVKLSFAGIGGKRPDESWLRVVGGAFGVPNQQFEKGQDVHVELRLRVTEVAFSDTLDTKTAQATTSKRVHKGRVIGAVVIEQSAMEKLNELTDAVNGFLDRTVSESVLAGILGRDDVEERSATAPMV
jgi:hypothetical protein